MEPLTEPTANLLIQLGVAGGALLVLSLFAGGVLAVLRWFAGRALDLLERRIGEQLDRIEGKLDRLGPCRLQLYDPESNGEDAG